MPAVLLTAVIWSVANQPRTSYLCAPTGSSVGPPDGIVVVRHLLVSGGVASASCCVESTSPFLPLLPLIDVSYHVSRDAAPPTGRPSDSLRSAVRARWQLMFFSLCHLMDPRVHSFELHTMTRYRGVGEKHQVYTLQSYYT